MESNFTSQKQQHVDFVSHLNGTNICENYYLISLPILLNMCISFWTINLFQLGYGDFKGNKWLHFFSVVVPYIFSITILSDYLCSITTFVGTLALLGFVNSVLLSKSSKYWPEIQLSFHEPDKKKISLLIISQMRGIILLMSAICILAVDMKIFPRRYAKTETSGLGSMDLGVGLFTLILGMVDNWAEVNVARGIWRQLKNVGILLILGFARLIAIKWFDYQEHHSEYGLHWNFFFTIALVRLVSIAFDRRTKGLVSLSLMILAVGFLQYFLLGSYGLEAFCLDNSIARTSFQHANKEGLISMLGYVLLWLIGCLLGALIRRRRTAIFVLLFCSVAGPMLINHFTLLVSRRSANLGYVLWVTSSFCWCLCLLFVADVTLNWTEDRANYVTSTNYPDTYSAINRHGMIHFLLANLLTGAINCACNTLELAVVPSLLVLIAYTALPIIVLYLVDKFRP